MRLPSSLPVFTAFIDEDSENGLVVSRSGILADLSLTSLAALSIDKQYCCGEPVYYAGREWWRDHTCAECTSDLVQPVTITWTFIGSNLCVNSTYCPVLHRHYGDSCRIVDVRRNNRKRRRAVETSADDFSETVLMSPLPGLELQAGWLFGEPASMPERYAYTPMREKVMLWTASGLMDVFYTVRDTVFGKEELENKSFTSRFLTIANDEEFVVKLVEDLLVLIYGLFSSKGAYDRHIALITFIKLRGSPIEFSAAALVANQIFDFVFSSPKMDLQSDDFFADARLWIDSYEKVKKLAIFKKTYRFCMFLLAQGVCNKVGVNFDYLNYTKLEEEAIKRDFSSRSNMVHCILDTVLFYCEIGVQCFKTGSLYPILHSGTSYEKWFDEVRRIQRLALHTSNLEAHGTTIFAYVADLKKCIEQGKSVKSFGVLDEVEKKVVRNAVDSLLRIDAELLTRRKAQEERAAPFSLLIYGPSSVAKSAFQQLCFYHYGRVLGLPLGDEYKYTRTPGVEFWDNFASSMWCAIVDDAAFRRPASGVEDTSVLELLQMINNVPYVPNQADLANKGRTPFLCKLVMATTNTMHLNVNAYYSCPLAVSRRFPYVVCLQLKDEFADDQGMVDPQKMPESSELEFPDIWRIIVKKPVKVDDKSVPMWKEVAAFSSIYRFLEWYTQKILAHEKAQINAVQTSKKMADIAVCDICFIPFAHCRCGVRALRHAFPNDDRFGSDSGSGVTGSNPSAYDPDLDEAGSHVERLETVLNSSTSFWREIREHGLDPNYVLQSDEVRQWWFTYVRKTVEEHQRSFQNLVFDVKEGLAPFWCVKCYNKEEHFCSLRGGRVCWEDGLAPYDANQEDCEVINTSSPSYQLKVWAYLKCLAWIQYCWLFECIVGFLFGSIWKYRLIRFFFSDWESLRVCIRCIGHRCERRIGFTPVMIRFFSYGVAAITLYKVVTIIQERMFGKEESKPSVNFCYVIDGDSSVLIGPNVDAEFQGVEFSKTEVIGKAPTPPVEPEKKNVWYYNDPYVVCDIDVSQQSRCLKGEDAQKVLVRKIFENIAYYRATTDGKPLTTQLAKAGVLFNVGSQVWMTNSHGIPETPFYLSLTKSTMTTCITPNVNNILVTASMVKRRSEMDLIFINLPCLPPGYNLVPYFGSEGLCGVFNGMYLGKFMSGAEFKKKVVNIRKNSQGFVWSKGEQEMVVRNSTWLGHVESDTVVGQCGSPLLTFGDAGAIILGIHALGGGGNACAALNVTRELLQSVISQFDGALVGRGSVPISSESAPRELTDLHRKSPVLFTQCGVANVFGSFKGFRAHHKSNVRPTLICESVQRRGYKLTCGKPDMTYMPFYHALQDMVNMDFNLNMDILDKCKRAYFNDVMSLLSQEELDQVMVFDDVTVVNGAPGVAYCKKMNRNTSIGAPFKKPKRGFLEPIEGPPGTEYVQFNQEIKDRTNRILTSYQKGVLFHPQFCGHLKDEARSFKKIKAQLTRVFCGAETAYCIMMRKFYLSLIMLIERNKFVFESCPGAVAQSLEWEEMLEFLLHPFDGNSKSRDKFAAGDFGKFDKKMLANLILAAFWILIEIAKQCGFSDADIQQMWCLAYDTAFPFVDFNGDLFQFFGTNPSGHPLTVIINCLVHCLYMRYVFEILSSNLSKKERESTVELLNKWNPERKKSTIDVTDFRVCVSLLTYGDDGLLSVSDACPWFNHSTIQSCLKTIGVEYTMADKEAESRPYITIDECTFLKRSWCWDSDIGAYVAPIDESSIEKSLTVCIPSKTICQEAHDVQTISTAVREYFFYGREIFEQKVQMFKEIISENNLGPWVENSTFPSWDELRENFWANSQHVSIKRLSC